MRQIIATREFASGSRRATGCLLHRRRQAARVLLALTLMLSLASVAAAYDSQSDGSDGAFNPTSDVTIDLSLAKDGNWHDTPGTGTGVYDATQWAVVFKYTTINIPSGVTVRFKNHPKNPPVVWLASGNVTIAGKVNLNGQNSPASPPSFAAGGPGGFAGGIAGPAGFSAGMGPGGGPRSCDAGFGTAGTCNPPGLSYSTPTLLPLIGGSGGGAFANCGAGGGGGAILMASSGTISLMAPGGIDAYGGTASSCGPAALGSGGAIRLVADQVSGTGILRSTNSNGGTTGLGRIRVEAISNSLSDPGIPVASTALPGPIFPAPGGPQLRATLVQGKAVPSDPVAGITSEDVLINSGGSSTTIIIEANNVPLNSTVVVRIVPDNGLASTVTAPPLSGSLALSTATVTTTFPIGRSEVQLRAVLP